MPKTEARRGIAARLAVLALAVATSAPALAATVVEYVNTDDFPTAPGGHYFYSSDPAEQAAIDAGNAGKFQRTGLVFYTGGGTQVCRFYGSVTPGPNSHFFTADAAECAALKAQQVTPRPANVKQWNYEGLGFAVEPKTAAGGCPAGTLPVYRAYNNGAARGVDSNHRYSTSPYALAALAASHGWVGEGIVFCSLQPAGLAPLASEALDCGTLDDPGVTPPLANSSTKVAAAVEPLQRKLVDLVKYPDAVCNDGTAAVFYYRPFVGEANRNKWVFDVRGGGFCGSPADCAARWCGVGTAFDMGVMSANFAAAQKTNEGILARESDTPLAVANPHKDYNHVELKYCSSDQWTGTAGDTTFDTVHPVTGAPLRMRMPFGGARAFDAMIGMLRRESTPPLDYTAGAAPATMPDLDDADEVLLAGPSAGGGGVTYNLDRLREVLRANNTKCTGTTCPLMFRGLIDSRFAPSFLDLDFAQSTPCMAAGLCTPEAYLREQQASGPGLLWKPRFDQSCIDLLKPLGADWRCFDATYVIRNHLTTPFFVRNGLTDSLLLSTIADMKLQLPGQGPLTVLGFAQKVRADLLGLASIRSTALEKNAITTVPGVFGPSCSWHDTLESAAATYQMSVQVSGTGWKMFDVWNNWVAGKSPSIVTSGTATDATCP